RRHPVDGLVGRGGPVEGPGRLGRDHAIGRLTGLPGDRGEEPGPARGHDAAVLARAAGDEARAPGGRGRGVDVVVEDHDVELVRVMHGTVPPFTGRTANATG